MTKAESAASRTPKLGKAHIEAIRRQWDQDLYPCSAEFYALCNMALQAADKDALLREAQAMLADLVGFAAHERMDLYDRITAALAEKDDGGWIKCSERLPTDDSPVLVATQDNVYRSMYYRDRWLMPTVGAVTHWRPLPPLPKGDK